MLGYEELGFTCSSGRLPTYEWIAETMQRLKVSDLYIISPAVSWTLVVTNEQDSYGGPFFVVDHAADPGGGHGLDA